MIEEHFDVPFVARLAQREKQIQQSYRPIISVHKWFARRPGALFRALLLAEFDGETPLRSSYFSEHEFKSMTVADPFMGGGTPLFEANRLGFHVVGADVNPMAYWIVRQELSDLDRDAFQSTAEEISTQVEHVVGDLYRTTCVYCGNEDAQVKYFLWIKQQPCAACECVIDLFSNYVVAKNQRHPNYVLLCPTCDSLNEVPALDKEPGAMQCNTCNKPLVIDGPARRTKCSCPNCGFENSYPQSNDDPPSHRLYALEYHCSTCKPDHDGRFFKSPDELDLARFREAESRLQALPQRYVPDELIPSGDETDRLHRWGYRRYRELFNARQLLGLETLATAIASVEEESIRHALLTVFSDTLRYQNMLCRYDSYALKIIDIFSVHGFPVSLAQCENSLLGIPGIGSGGFRHFVKKYGRAKAYCQKPFEVYPMPSRPKVYFSQEQIGGQLTTKFPRPDQSKSIYLQALSGEQVELPNKSLDAVLTDPPYFANVQYAELMDFCYVWLKRHLVGTVPGFQQRSTRTDAELTVNDTEGRDVSHFTSGLSRVFTNFAQALKPGSPFVFTYHHNDYRAYLPVAVALLDAGLVCTDTLPCPAEMGVSLHINGTKSSVVDTVFICRTTGTIEEWKFKTTQNGLKRMLTADLENLQQADLTPTDGDAHCLLLGHLTRLTVWRLQSSWKKDTGVSQKLARVEGALHEMVSLDRLDQLTNQTLASLPAADPLAAMRVHVIEDTGTANERISF